jgi:hypothetical protein
MTHRIIAPTPPKYQEVQAPKRSRLPPYSRRWEALANQLARSAAPEIYPCAHCQYPVLEGWCCTGCGSSSPHGAEEAPRGDE